MAFLETPQFDVDISYGSSGGPKFKTFVFESQSGIEQRNVNWSIARAEYNVSHGIRDKADMDTLIAFFYAVNGRADGFRFKDWADYESAANPGDTVSGTVDGTTGSDGNATFLLQKTYTSGANSYVRRIFKPVSGTVVVYRDSVLESASNYTLDTTVGSVVFDAPNIPLAGEVISAVFEFDVAARFDTDHMSVAHDAYLTESWGSIPVVELILEEA